MGTSGISAFRIPPIAKRCARNPLWEFTQKMQIDGRGIAMPIRAGVLIIGSLLWDGRHGRPRWRQRRLDVSARQQVWAPIRYGRFSNCRKTYTMVFSRLCYRQCCLGIAQVVPCVKPIRSRMTSLKRRPALQMPRGSINGLGVRLVSLPARERMHPRIFSIPGGRILPRRQGAARFSPLTRRANRQS